MGVGSAPPSPIPFWREGDKTHTMSGNAWYVPTTVGQPVQFQAGVDLDDLALEWDAEGYFSKLCAICWRVRFRPGRVRTLPCGHSYCEGCIGQCVRPNDEVTCPLCKRVCFLGPAAEGLEKGYNDLLVAYQAATLEYYCPFEGCGRRVLAKDVEAHLEGCPFRRFVCVHGCDSVFTKAFLHRGPLDCLAFLRAEVATLTETVVRLEAAVAASESRGRKRPRL